MGTERTGTMSEFYNEIISELPEGTELTKENDKNIHRLFPIPSDFNIVWASVEEFGGHPSGIVITDKALILKGTSDGVKAVNKERKENPDASKKANKLSAIYQIILWEHFDADDFVVIETGNGSYTIEYALTKYPNFSRDCLAKAFIKKATEKNAAKKLAYEAAVANASLSVMGFDRVVFAAMYGTGTNDKGHGIFAEEAGALLDKLNRERVEVVGRDNAKDGPDKIVGGNPVQCKYTTTANSTVGGCFRKNASGKYEFRYFDMSGNPMMVEVPKDQYDKAIELMKNRIIDGQVPGVSDPNAAYDIIRKGKLTYSQARNLAKAGTIESLTYDVATGAIDCTFAFGLSALTTFAFALFQTKDPKRAAKEAAITGLQTFGLSLGTQVLSTQIARTSLQKSLIPLSDFIVQKLGSKTIQNLINAMRKLAGKKPIYGGAAQKSLAKALRANVITQAITFVVFSIPDTVRLARRRMSGVEYAKNLTSLFTSFVGAGAGGFGATVAISKFAKNIPNLAAKVIVFVGATAAGVVVGEVTRKVFKIFREDDAVILSRMFDAALMNICVDYMFNESEIEDFLSLLFKDKESAKALNLTMKKLYSSEKQYLTLQAVMEVAAMKVAQKRDVLKKDQEPDEDTLTEALAEVIESSELEDID
jgi:hypothetical protein